MEWGSIPTPGRAGETAPIPEVLEPQKPEPGSKTVPIQEKVSFALQAPGQPAFQIPALE